MGILVKLLSVLPPLTFLGLAIAKWVRNRRVLRQDLGLAPTGLGGWDLAAGLLIGTLAMLGIFGVEWACGWLKPGAFHLPGLKLPAVLALMACLALLEELIHRGGVLTGLRLFLPPWLAIGAAALVFGVAHAANPHASVLSVLNNALGGVMYALAFVGSGGIWLSFGLHLAWNAVQGPCLGFPVSGLDYGGLWHPAVSGPEGWTGAAYGPEGGLVGIGFRLAIIAATILYLRATRAARRTTA